MAKKKLFLGSAGEKTLYEIWELYTLSQTAKGVTDITLRNYRQHLRSISKHLDIDTPMCEITKHDLDRMVVSMRESGLANNSAAAYVRRMRAFLEWCNKEGYSSLKMANIREQDTADAFFACDSTRLYKPMQKPAPEMISFLAAATIIFAFISKDNLTIYTHYYSMIIIEILAYCTKSG